MRKRLLLLCLLALVLPPSATGSRTMFVGAAEDAGRGDPLWAKTKMDLAAAAGFSAIRLTSIWAPGRRAPSAGELVALGGAAGAANLAGIRILITVMPYGSRTVPLTAKARVDFAAYAASLVAALPTVHDYIVGNEPNINRYWLPQFNRDGSNAAAIAYEAMLAQAYDAMKAVDPAVNVIGGSVSPRGADRPGAARQTHSPTTFIPDLGRAYRASGRTRPIMDGFAFHPYGESSKVPPTFRHPRSTTIGLSDYGKLVRLLGVAFDGTAQKGSRLPIVYDEYGVQSRIPAPKSDVYTNLTAPSGRDAVPESVQADYYRQAILIAACQPTVAGFLIFHVTDEPDLDRWQSGVYYADDTPKSTLAPVRQAIGDARGADCAGGASAEGAADGRAIWKSVRAGALRVHR